MCANHDGNIKVLPVKMPPISVSTGHSPIEEVINSYPDTVTPLEQKKGNTSVIAPLIAIDTTS